MGGITIAWLAGEAIIIYRHVTRERRPPMPGQLLGSSGFFALAAVLAEYAPARPAATLLAWGIVIAAYLQVPVVAGASPAAAPARAQTVPTGATAPKGQLA